MTTRKRKVLTEACKLLANPGDSIRILHRSHESRVARYERNNLEGGDPLNLTQDTLQIYQACYNRARLMGQKIKRVMTLWESVG